ncbi:hypothetical protein [Flavobacterium sp. H4147]|uniref:hypothetical protein n=1 Tax=Flavobacterium sp. H4147 TaxID=3034149 RepID=UPI0023EC72A5|nr:hypothetical protein [Flavobacterium sp. H4147]
MEENITIAYNLSCINNHEYFFENAPKSVFCDECECRIDFSYLPTSFKIRNKADFSATYERRFISSLKFKKYIEGLNFNVDFLPLNEDNSLFLMKPLEILEFSAWQKDRFCNKCNQYNDQVVPVPDFFHKTGKIIEEGIFSTSVGFGSGREISPSFILGVKTTQIIEKAIKENKFRGLSINKIQAQKSYFK